jgi:carboxyl-terminal processing protease
VTPPWDYEAERQQTSGLYGGIGVLTSGTPEPGPGAVMRISGLKPDGPAAKAGLLLGEEILAVGGVTIAQLLAGGTKGAIENAIRGPEGTEVLLSVRSRTGAVRDVSIRRAAISSGSVFGARFVDAERKIGYVRIQNFHLDTGRDFRLRVKELLDQGMRALVLDLRANNGGLLPQALDVANALVASGTLVRMRGRTAYHTEVHDARPEEVIAPDLPVAVLVDRRSASASEVLAGALQDHRRGVIVGEPTYGKFKVQTVRNVLTEAGTAVLKLTTSLYETPNGTSHQRFSHGSDPLAGLRPDLTLYVPDDERAGIDGVFAGQVHSDWMLETRPEPAGTADRTLDAAVALLRGEPYFPELPRGS